MTTRAQVAGAVAEAVVAARLERAGWRILGRNVRVGRYEVDLVAGDPGPPQRLVAVEVRWRSRSDHGHPEETVDRRKIRRLRASIAGLSAAGRLPDGTPLPPWAPAIDVVAVEPSPGGCTFRHLRDVVVD